jgi:hypothetical protein
MLRISSKRKQQNKLTLFSWRCLHLIQQIARKCNIAWWLLNIFRAWLAVIKFLMNNQTTSAFASYKSVLWANIFVSQSLFDYKYNAVRLLKSTMYINDPYIWEMCVEPKQMLVYT